MYMKFRYQKILSSLTIGHDNYFNYSTTEKYSGVLSSATIIQVWSTYVRILVHI